MTESKAVADDEISLFAIATTLIGGRRRIASWMLAGAVLAALTGISAPKLYKASTSFTPQGSVGSRAGLAGLAGQFGFSIGGGGNLSSSPEFYTDLVQSRVVLLPIARDTLVVPELGGRRIPTAELLQITDSGEQRYEETVKALRNLVRATMVPTTGVVELSVMTKWRSVSLSIMERLVEGINEHNDRTRRSQASAERRIAEERLAIADANLRAAEERLAEHLRRNRDIGRSAELQIIRDRIQRDVSFRQQLVATLTQSVEEARIREGRDTPVITTLEPPWVPILPEPRGRLKRVLLGAILGGLFSTLLIFASAALRSRREANPDIANFLEAMREMVSGIPLIGRRLTS